MRALRLLFPLQFLLIVWALLGLSGPARATEKRDLREVADTLALPSAYTNSHALIVGINAYPHLPKDKQLHYAVNDALAMRSVLIQSYGFPAGNVTVLTDAKATRAAIERELARLSDKREVKPNDRVLIYFSGHGQTVNLPGGGKMGFLLPSDASVDLTDIDNAGPFQETCIRMKTVWEYLDTCPAKHALLIADACYGGQLKEKSLAPISRQSVKAYLNRRARQVMTAGDEGQTVDEDPEWGHGAFTYKLLEELKAQAIAADRAFTAVSLFDAIQEPVMELTGQKQTPVLGDHLTQGQFLFITTPPRNVPSLGKDAPADSAGPVEPKLGAVKVNPADGAEMVYVPSGAFTMGSDEVFDLNKEDALANAKPAHRVSLDGYWIYKTPVTVAQYRKFCAATGRAMPDPPAWEWIDSHPIVNVTWDDAAAYAAWAKARLPTEAEWEKAARGTDGRKFPWGDEFDPSRLWRSKSYPYDAKQTAPVGSFPAGASPCGALDMAGNVWQWVQDKYDKNYYRTALTHNPPGPTFSSDILIAEQRVMRGGSWADTTPISFYTAYRGKFKAGERDSVDGFRCAVGGRGS